MHADLKARDSLVCDLMEAVRPDVDADILDLLVNKPFRKTDFFETREGVCRIMPPVTTDLIQTSQRWSRKLGTVVELVATTLMKRTPTLLTGSKRSAGRIRSRDRYRSLSA
jgi:CRISPR/Cas system-associated endonuclease Cas1